MAVAVDLAEVQRAEIGAERLVDQVFVDAEEEGSGLVAGRLAVTEPEETVCLVLTVDDFDGGGHGLNMDFEGTIALSLAEYLVYKLSV